MSSSWDRDSTCPAWRTKAASSASSRADSGTSRPASTARWETGSTVSDPALSAPASVSLARTRARTRAASSSSENGFVR